LYFKGIFNFVWGYHRSIQRNLFIISSLYLQKVEFFNHCGIWFLIKFVKFFGSCVIKLVPLLLKLFGSIFCSIKFWRI